MQTHYRPIQKPGCHTTSASFSIHIHNGRLYMDLVIKSLPANAGDGGNEGLISGVRKMPWRRAWQFILVFLCVCLCVCLRAVLLWYGSHIIQITHLKYAIQWLLVYSQIWILNIFVALKRNRMSFSCQPTTSPHLSLSLSLMKSLAVSSFPLLDFYVK